MGVFRPNLRQEVMGTEEDVQVYVDSVIQPKANPKNLEEIKQATQADSEMQVLVQLIEQGWPKYKKDTPREMQEFYGGTQQTFGG